MKKLSIYVLVCLITIAYSYETIVYITKVLQYDTVSICDDMDNMEKEQDTKKGDNKEDKKEFKEYLSYFSSNNAHTSFTTSLWLHYRDLYAANHFSQCVYSPPETALI